MRAPELFPYEPRPIQGELMGLFSEGIRAGGCVLAEAGSGSGKTICALVPTLQESMKLGCRVLYLTRTNSQQVQVFRELRAISKRRPVLGVGIQGRHSTCLLIEDEREWLRASPEELSLLCNDKKAAARTKPGTGCPYFEKLQSTDLEKLKAWATHALPTVEESTKHCREMGICPYESAKLLTRLAEVVVAPYVYFLSPFIRARLLDWMNCPVQELVVVVDEAHNLPEFARSLKSVSLGTASLKLAAQEARDAGELLLLDNIMVPQFCERMEELILQLKDEYLLDEDGLVPPGAVEEELMSTFRWTSIKLEGAVGNLAAHGEVIRENRRKNGQIPRSYVHSVGAFLALWMGVESDAYVKLIKDGDAPRLEAYCMDPGLAAEPLRRCHSSIHMSGTLQPLDEYHDSLGLPEKTFRKAFSSIFPEENRLIVFDNSVTMKYEERRMDEGLLSGILEKAVKLCKATTRNTAVFFPSYDIMETALAGGFGPDTGRKLFIEERGLAQHDLMETIDMFKKEGHRGGDGAVLLSVIGGRVSEGIDFPDSELEVAVIIGIPYPKPTAKQRALQYYYDIKFGKGWEYTVKAPTARKLLQSIGRLIRSEKDRGVAVILDRRAAQFKEYIPSMRETDDPLKEVLDFWSANHSGQGR